MKPYEVPVYSKSFKISVPSSQKTVHFHYIDQPIKSIGIENRCILQESYNDYVAKLHICLVLKQAVSLHTVTTVLYGVTLGLTETVRVNKI
jgi:hypothetical protein